MVYPMFAMVVLTTVFGCFAFFARINSVKSGQGRLRTYKLMNTSEFPEEVAKTTGCFNNQFQVPVLFYIGCLLYLILNLTSPVALFIAWAFVLTRCAHGFIYITYNHLLHRVIAFWLSVVAVLILWIHLLILCGNA